MKKEPAMVVCGGLVIPRPMFKKLLESLAGGSLVRKGMPLKIYSRLGTEPAWQVLAGILKCHGLIARLDAAAENLVIVSVKPKLYWNRLVEAIRVISPYCVNGDDMAVVGAVSGCWVFKTSTLGGLLADRAASIKYGNDKTIGF